MASRVTLETDVQFVKGVGPPRAHAFARLGLNTVGDLIEYFPVRHELLPQSVPIDSLRYGAVATIVGELRSVSVRGFDSRQRVTATVVDGTGRCRARWFNSPFLVDRLHGGDVVRLTGKVDVDERANVALLTNPKLTRIDEGDDAFAGDVDRYLPVYPASGRLPSKLIARVIGHVLPEAVDQVVDWLPEALRRRHRFPRRGDAILRYHCPTSPEDVQAARRRLAYDELLLCQVAVQLGRRRLSVGYRARPVVTTEAIDARIRRRFPFTLTEGQDRALADIRSDLARSVPMNRLLQGDVGAGKTAVAVYASLTTIANGRQAALLAPTEVLAGQHHRKFSQYLTGSRVRTGYLSGSTPRAERRELLSAMGDGRIDLMIGTHALLEPDVAFSDLGLVIIDEQHKFGVAQRARLRRKGTAPHTLVLTATPIPRTLAMTVFGDLDVSTITGVLPGRRPVITRLV
ncbi:MAG: ATP-dependent DNA helicase RecG, partial [Phycisphaerae bacterium]